MATQQFVAIDAGRSRFRALTADVWRAFRWMRDRDLLLNSPEEAVSYLVRESAARDLLTRLFYALDSGDLALTASLFTADATVSGQSGVLEQLEGWMAGCTYSRHRYTNTIIRVGQGGEEIWFTCYLHQARIRASTEVDSRYARCIGRLEKDGEGWRIADWYQSVDLIHRYGTEAEMVAAGPQVRDRLKSDRASRALGPHASPPIDGSRDTWNTLREDVWEAHHWFADQTVSVASADQQLQRLVDEMLIREMLANYAYAHDSRDLAWSGSVFADDAILINNTLRFDGNAAVIEAFRGFNRRMVVSFHRFANPRIRFVPGRPEAWFVAYYHVPTLGPDGHCQYGFGRYFGRLTKRSGRWQIADWRIANDPSVLPMQLGSE